MVKADLVYHRNRTTGKVAIGQSVSLRRRGEPRLTVIIPLAVAIPLCHGCQRNITRLKGVNYPGCWLWSSKDVKLPAPSCTLTTTWSTRSAVMGDLYKLEVISLVNKITQEVLNHTSKRNWRAG